MAREIDCVKLQKKALGFDSPPYPGELGQRIYQQVSKEAWALWQNHQTMLINEYRLSMLDPKARSFIADEMEKFLFGEGSQAPAGFVSPDAEE